MMVGTSGGLRRSRATFSPCVPQTKSQEDQIDPVSVQELVKPLCSFGLARSRFGLKTVPHGLPDRDRGSQWTYGGAG